MKLQSAADMQASGVATPGALNRVTRRSSVLSSSAAPQKTYSEEVPPGPMVDTASMRNTHSCPKCRNAGILRIPGMVGRPGLNNIPVSFFNAVLVTRYLCDSCGFSEEWVDDSADLENLRTKYKT